MFFKFKGLNSIVIFEKITNFYKVPKRLSDEKKKEMAEAFKKGSDIEQLSNRYSLTESTVNIGRY